MRHRPTVPTSSGTGPAPSRAPRLNRVSMEIEIGRAKRARRVYAFDDIAVVPSRRTRDPEDVSVSWSIDAYQFAIPFIAAPMDSVVSPTTAIMMGQLGGLGVLDLEGLWTRYEDPEPLLAEIRELPAERATAADAGDLLRADQAGAGRPAARRDPRGRRDRGRRAVAAAHAGAVRDRRRRRASTCSSSAARRCRPSTSRRTSSR